MVRLKSSKQDMIIKLLIKCIYQEVNKTLENDHTYIAVDLKSFYASVECVERQLDPMDTNLVVADAARTEKRSALPSLRP